MSHFELMPNDDGIHSLLEPPSPAYSNMTVRRAFIVWQHCGQQNEFKDVCNYYHYLELLEESLPEEQRASSRFQEFKLLSHMPPTSYLLHRLFPKLYKQRKIDYISLKNLQEVKFDDCVFNLEGFHLMKKQKGVTTNEIIKASQIIRHHCKTHSKSLRKFLSEFQDFTKKCELVNSVTTVVVYIKKNNVKDEIETWKNLPRHFTFLDVEMNKEELMKGINCTKTDIQPANIKSAIYSIDKTVSAPMQNNMRILINDSRRKELMNLMPHFSGLSINKNVKNNSKRLC